MEAMTQLCMRASAIGLALIGIVGLTAVSTFVEASGRKQPEPPKVKDTGPVKPPNVKGIEVLFAGSEKDMKDNWLQNGQPANWKIVNGAMESQNSDIETKNKYTDFQLHVEFRVPYMPNEHGQGRGNSGVFLRDIYELQVLDSYGKEVPGTGDCGALYSQSAPLINATKPPLAWQTYDVVFHAPRYEDGKLTTPGHLTVIQNGITVQNNTPLNGPTFRAAKPDEVFDQPGSIRLQYHHNSVQYRNIWILPLPEKGSDKYE